MQSLIKKDSVYLTPTSEDSYGPLNLACALAQNASGILDGYNFYSRKI